jgi:Protein of unknown function (DUF1579)
MSTIRHVPLLLQIACLVCLVSLSRHAVAQDSVSYPTSVTALMRQMTGTWQVRSRMWPGPNAKAVDLPPAVARRELIRDTYLQEVMEPGGKSGEPPFTRVAYLSYNLINQQYEYFSLDSRLPQMMSYALPGANKTREGKVELIGTTFVVPEWGAEKNVPFMYRLTIGPIESNTQVIQLFLTRQSGQSSEFVAFEYVYSR